MPPWHVLVTTSGWLADVRISPDGRRIAFTEHSVIYDDRGSVAVVEMSWAKTMLTKEFDTVLGLAWSPDGSEIWFSAQGQSRGMRRSIQAVTLEGRVCTISRFPTNVILYDIAPDGRALLASKNEQNGIRGKSGAENREIELGWLDVPYARALSEDGRVLLFDDMGESTGPGYTAYLRNTDGSPPVRLGESSGRTLSPDGRWVLAIRYGPPHRLNLIRTGSGETLWLPAGHVETYQIADFLPDGKRIVFVGAEHGRPQRSWIQEPPDGLPRAVTPEGTAGVTTSPDGRWVAAVTQDSTLMFYPVQGGEPRTVAKLGQRELVSQWCADGRTLYVAHEGYPLEVSGIDIESGKRQPWKTFELPDPAGARLLGFFVTRDERSYVFSYFRTLDDLYLAEGLR